MIILLIVLIVLMVGISIIMGFKNIKLKEDILNKEQIIKFKEAKLEKLEHKIQASEFARKAMVNYYLNASDAEKVKGEVSYNFKENEDGTCVVALGLCKSKGCLLDEHEFSSVDGAIYASKVLKDLGYKPRENLCLRSRKEAQLGIGSERTINDPKSN